MQVYFPTSVLTARYALLYLTGRNICDVVTLCVHLSRVTHLYTLQDDRIGVSFFTYYVDLQGVTILYILQEGIV